jgi:uncharacterized membrane protein
MVDGSMSDLLRRSIAKTISFRVIGSGANFIFAWLMTGSVAFATGLVAFQWTVIMILYYIHERVWDRITWGKADG